MKIKKHVKPVVAVVALLAAIVGENLLRSKTHQFG